MHFDSIYFLLISLQISLIPVSTSIQVPAGINKELKRLAKKYPSVKKIIKPWWIHERKNQSKDNHLARIVIKSAWPLLLKAKVDRDIYLFSRVTYPEY